MEGESVKGKKRVQREKEMTKREQMAKGKLSYSLAWWSGVTVMRVLNGNMENAWH